MSSNNKILACYGVQIPSSVVTYSCQNLTKNRFRRVKVYVIQLWGSTVRILEECSPWPQSHRTSHVCSWTLHTFWWHDKLKFLFVSKHSSLAWLAKYLRHEYYNTMWCFRIKLFTVCFSQTQNLAKFHKNKRPRVKKRKEEKQKLQIRHIRIEKFQSQKSACPSKCQDMELCSL